MKRSLIVLGTFALLFCVSLLASASAQETPLCGPPGEEVPATIVGAGTINGTPGDDVIVGSAGVDHIDGGPGNDIICGEGGNDVVERRARRRRADRRRARLCRRSFRRTGTTTIVLTEGRATTCSPASAATTRSRADRATTS